MTRGRALARWAVGACLLSSASPALSQVDPSISVMEEAATRYRQVTTLCADFRQRLEVPLLREERSGRGRLCQAQPDLFAMRFDEPEGDRIIADGVWLWIYQPSIDDKTALRRRMVPGVTGAAGYDFHREFLSNPSAKYDATYQGEEQLGRRSTHRIRLVPKGVVSYQAAVIWIDRGTLELRQIRIEDENESVRTVTLDAIETDLQVPEGWFIFERPPGVQVITR